MSEDARRIMAANIEYHMKRLHISRTELCKALGFKYTTVCEWLNANKYPRIDKIEALADYFGVTTADLVYDCTLEQSDVDFYRTSADALARQLSITEQLQLVLSNYDEIGDYKFSDADLNQILQYAKFLKEQ